MIAFRYQLCWGAAARQFLKKLRDEALSRRLQQAAQNLLMNPYPPGAQKLHGRPGYRIRVGDYRIIYQVDGNELLILVVDIGHRREIYR